MKNGCIAVRDTGMYYVSFGKGKKSLIVLPGLSDGLATVKGKAFLLAFPYRKFFKDYTVYISAGKTRCRRDTQYGRWQMTKPRQ